MTARPALCTAQEVRDILAGTKTQMRRVVRPQPVDPMHGGDLPSGAVPDSLPRCPYGQPGDTLWVRETWTTEDSEGAERVIYRADIPQTSMAEEAAVRRLAGFRSWRSSTTMPRWASRLTLEVVSVRVERLQAITEADAKAEGVTHDPRPVSDEDLEDPREVGYPSATAQAHSEATKHRRWFAALWESLHGPGSWAVNPWVWVLEFRRVEP